MREMRNIYLKNQLEMGRKVMAKLMQMNKIRNDRSFQRSIWQDLATGLLSLNGKNFTVNTHLLT